MDRTKEDLGEERSYLVYEFERRAYPLADSALTIGRDAENIIVIREPAVSRSHAQVRAEGDGYVLHTSGATGTRVNGSAVVAPTNLQNGDRIAIGSADFTFRRGRLPLGVAVVDVPSPDAHDSDAMTRRQTITNPILGASQAPPEKKKSAVSTLLLLVILSAAAGWYLLMR